MSLLALLQTGCLATLAIVLITAGWHDLRTQRIADNLSLSTVTAFALWAAAGVALGRMSGATVAISIICSLIVFAVAASGFAAGVVGGGDVKLMAASSLFAGPAHLTDFLIVTTLAGGVLGLAFLVGVPIGSAVPAGDGTICARLRSRVPYGPAIAAGGLWVAAALCAA